MIEHLAQSFDLSDGGNILRIICGLFFIPHLIAKFTEREYALGFFRKVGFRPAEAWLYGAFVIEILASIGLVFAIWTAWAALLGAAFLLVAAGATWRFSGGRWLWNLGGCEYPLFWAICCIVVAING
jgi:putative oxidoreductase